MGLFGLRLLELRKAANLTQATLARQIGSSDTFISLLENGRKLPSIVTVTSLAQALGVDQQELHQLLIQDKLDEDAERRQRRKPVAFVASGDTTSEFQAFLDVINEDRVFRDVVLKLYKKMQTMPKEQKKAFLDLLDAFASQPVNPVAS